MHLIERLELAPSIQRHQLALHVHLCWAQRRPGNLFISLIKLTWLPRGDANRSRLPGLVVVVAAAVAAVAATVGSPSQANQGEQMICKVAFNYLARRRQVSRRGELSNRAEFPLRLLHFRRDGQRLDLLIQSWPTIFNIAGHFALV